MSQQIRISLFGKLTIRLDAERVIAIEAKRAQELLCYLLLFRDHLHEREKIATLMWGDKSTTRSRQYLRQVLWQVQSGFQDPALCKQLLSIDRDWIGINPGAIILLDVAVFSQAYGNVEKIPGNALVPEQIQMLQEAIYLYKGELLEGWYDDWCIIERERYQNMYLAMLDKMLNYAEIHHVYEAGLAYGAQILRCDRAREHTHRSLMTLHWLAGNRSAAVSQYKACVAALDEELGVAPAESTIALYKQIFSSQSDKHPQVATPTVAHPETVLHPQTAAASLTSTLFELEKIHATLHLLQSQIDQLTEMLEHSHHS